MPKFSFVGGLQAILEVQDGYFDYPGLSPDFHKWFGGGPQSYNYLGIFLSYIDGLGWFLWLSRVIHKFSLAFKVVPNPMIVQCFSQATLMA